MSEGGSMHCVLLVYHVMCRIFFNSVPEKEAIDPKEVETELERTGGLFQVLLELIFVYD